jgi:hypothetical protein
MRINVLKSIYENEAEATFFAFNDYIQSLIDRANSDHGEKNWMLTFDFAGKMLNLETMELKSTLIILRGTLPESGTKYDFFQHYSAFRCVAYVIKNENTIGKNLGSNIFTLVYKGQEKPNR